MMQTPTELLLERLSPSNGISRGESRRVTLESANAVALQKRSESIGLYCKLRRAAEVVVVLLACPAALVILAACAIAIVILMGRPVLFVQERIGLNGRKFSMLKLRSMSTSTTTGSNATAANDPRITPLGAFLRRFHFDELPQLWNILTGDMSFIGPRPEQPELVAYYRSVIPHYDLRHLVSPGLTGWSQVYFGYAANVHETRTKLEYDLYYITNFGLRLDLQIIARTIWIYANPAYVR